MHQLSIREMRASLGQLDRLVSDAGELVVTRNGKAIARILPIGAPRTRPDHADLRRRTAPLEVDSATLIREERDER
ncbi:type II toxin-antitoxin system Phd/YefM family antitoxin [Endothiovibrio diazotrophicus]